MTKRHYLLFGQGPLFTGGIPYNWYLNGKNITMSINVTDNLQSKYPRQMSNILVANWYFEDQISQTKYLCGKLIPCRANISDQIFVWQTNTTQSKSQTKYLCVKLIPCRARAAAAQSSSRAAILCALDGTWQSENILCSESVFSEDILSFETVFSERVFLEEVLFAAIFWVLASTWQPENISSWEA